MVTASTQINVLASLPLPPSSVVPAFAVGADAGGVSTVLEVNPDGSIAASIQAFEDGFSGGVRVARDDVTGDGIADTIVGTGPGRVAEFRVFDGATGAQIRAITPFADFTGGVFVAAGDLTGDGVADVVVTPDEGGGPRVVVFRGGDYAITASFFGIDDPNFRGGARAAVGDLNHDGRPDLVVAAGFGGGPRVAAFDGKTVSGTPTKLFGDFLAFDPTLRNGVYAAIGDLDGDGYGDLFVGAGPGGGPRVLALSGVDLLAGQGAQGHPLANFFAGDANNRGGVRVAVTDLDRDGRADLVTGPGQGGGSHVSAYAGKDFGGGGAPERFGLDAFPGFNGGVFVG
jgi:hypothetical protein